MCRILLVRSSSSSDSPFEIAPHLEKFATLSRASKEFQGHGWGLAKLGSNEKFEYYKNINPIWEDDFGQFGRTTLLMIHARSAFKDEGIVIENNMPFFDDKYCFIFNGELRGVKIKEEGRIGAEKIFNYVKRFDKGDLLAAAQKGCGIIEKRTSYLRAMNFIISDGWNVCVASIFNEDPDYFQLCIKKGDPLIVCSQEYETSGNWSKIANNSIFLI